MTPLHLTLMSMYKLNFIIRAQNAPKQTENSNSDPIKALQLDEAPEKTLSRCD